MRGKAPERPGRRRPTSSRAKTAAADAPPDALVLRLYVADRAPNSQRAIANLEAICAEHLPRDFRLEVIDVLQEPERALADGVVVTPSLARVSPAPVTRVVGTLSDRKHVLRALGLQP